MAVQIFANNAFSTLDGSILVGATTINVQAVDAAKFPSPTAGDWFLATLTNGIGIIEIVRCTARAVAALTVVRAQEGTAAFAFASGSRIDMRLTKGSMDGKADLATQVVRYDAAQTLTPAQKAQARANLDSVIKGFIFGMTLSNAGGDPANDITIAIGECASVQADPVMIRQAGAFSKRLDAAWVVGSANGGLDTGAIANTTYHFYAIYRSDTGVSDYCFSASASAPTTGGAIPAAYDHYRRIGSIVRSGGAILGFIQRGDTFRFKVPVGDVAAADPGTAAVTATLTLPTGLNVLASVFQSVQDVSTGGSTTMLVSQLAATDTAPSASAMTAYCISTAGISQGGSMLDVWTNTVAQIRYRISQSTADHVVHIVTHGWTDYREQF